MSELALIDIEKRQKSKVFSELINSVWSGRLTLSLNHLTSCIQKIGLIRMARPEANPEKG